MVGLSTETRECHEPCDSAIAMGKLSTETRENSIPPVANDRSGFWAVTENNAIATVRYMAAMIRLSDRLKLADALNHVIAP